MKTTRILGEAIGIQSQGIVDHTETLTNERLTSAVFVGQFMRGRFDKPMTIHNGNIRGQLGHEPQNPYYIAVQDCLDTGVPSVQVLRIGKNSDDGGAVISCDGALNELQISGQGAELSLLFIVNDVVAGRVDGGLNQIIINEIIAPHGLVFDDTGIINNSDQFVRLKVIAGQFDENTNETLGYYNFWTLLSLDNPTVKVKQLVAPDYDIPESVEPQIYDEDTHTPMYAEVTTCLSPQANQISCDGATNVFSIVRSYPYENPTVPMTEEVTLWNGSTDQSSFGFEWLGRDIIDIPDGYDYRDNYRYNGDVPLRYEIKQLPVNQDQYRMKFDGDNPTIIQFSDNNYGVCLKADTNLISCDGATNNFECTIFFPLTDNFNPIFDDPFGYVNVIDFKVDGVVVPTNDLPFLIYVKMLKDGSEDVSEWVNGAVVKLVNNGQTNRRIQFTAPNDFFDVNQIINPTTMWDEETNQVTCCLSLFQISCLGATSSCELKNNPDHTPYMSISEVILNGVSYPRIENFFGGFDFPENTIQIKEVRVEEPREYYIEVKNLSDEFMRIGLIGYPDEDLAASNNTNPTLAFVDGDIPKAIVCLSPKENLFSCEGATSYVHFDLLQGWWIFSVNGEEVITGTPDDIRIYIENNLHDKLYCQNDGFFDLDSRDQINVNRYSLTPAGNNSVRDPSGNPTLYEDEDGVWYFCLAQRTG